MKILSLETKLCFCCMTTHEVQRVEIIEETIFKGVKVKFKAKYDYCILADELITFDNSWTENNNAMKDAYIRFKEE